MGNPLYGSNKLDNQLDAMANGKKQVYRFATPPIVHDYEHAAHQLVDGTAQDTVIHSYADGLNITWSAIVAQDIDRPAPTTGGMNYAGDQTDDDGIEWVYSCITTKGREGIDRFTVGKQAFSAELTFKLADVSGTDDCLFGFRKVEALNATVDNYDEMAAFNVISGDIKLETILNNAATTTTDTTDNWADGEAHKLKVSVDVAGAVTYQIDGKAPTTTAAFSFDAGEVVTPFFHLLHTSDLCETVEMQKFVVESDHGSLEA
jgi:hypothetical protein